MKKTYTQPTIDLTEMEVEQGIAMSIASENGISDIYLYEEEVDW